MNTTIVTLACSPAGRSGYLVYDALAPRRAEPARTTKLVAAVTLYTTPWLPVSITFASKSRISPPQMPSPRVSRRKGASAYLLSFTPEYAPDYYAIFFSDPDGIRLEITNYRQERRKRFDNWEHA